MLNSNIMSFSSHAAQIYYAGEISELTKAISDLMKLPVGWHYGKGEPAKKAAVETAINISRMLNLAGATKINAFPDVDGSVMLNADLNDVYHEVFCHDASKVTLVIDYDQEELSSPFEVQEYLGELEWRPENMFVWSTPNTMTMTVDALPHSPLVSPKRTKVSR